MRSTTAKGFALVALAVAGLWAYLYFGTATIQVTSEPEGAVVRVDGRQRGITPIDRLEVDAGSRVIVVQHSHFASHKEEIRFSRGDHIQRHISLQSGEGTLNLISNPRGAWVEIDGERLAQVTPTSAQVASGPHEIRMGQAERFVIEETHTVRDGESLDVNFNLNIDPHGSLTITTKPRGAQIEFLDSELKYAPKMRIRMGEYAIRVSKSGYKTQEFRHKVRYGDNLHQIALERDYGVLTVSAEPASAEVSVRYDDGGRTRRKTYSQPLTVPVGRVVIRARALGHRTEHKTVSLAATGATVRFRLQPMQVDVGATIQDRLSVGGNAPPMVVVPAGSFMMGDKNGSLSEQFVRKVTLTQPFAVSKYEVTVGDYRRFASHMGHAMHERLVDVADEAAMSFVAFTDALDYAAWLSKQTGNRYRLPSEAEWEYFARAGSQEDYFFGNDPAQLCDYGNVADLAASKVYRDWDTLGCDDGQVKAGTVGRYRANPFGLYDVYGNVSEWVLECGLPEYKNAPGDGSPASEGRGCTTHGFRGGSWDSMAVEAKSAYRNSAANANDDRGIRLVREL